MHVIIRGYHLSSYLVHGSMSAQNAHCDKDLKTIYYHSEFTLNVLCWVYFALWAECHTLYRCVYLLYLIWFAPQTGCWSFCWLIWASHKWGHYTTKHVNVVFPCGCNVNTGKAGLCKARQQKKNCWHWGIVFPFTLSIFSIFPSVLLFLLIAYLSIMHE